MFTQGSPTWRSMPHVLFNAPRAVAGNVRLYSNHWDANANLYDRLSVRIMEHQGWMTLRLLILGRWKAKAENAARKSTVIRSCMGCIERDHEATAVEQENVAESAREQISKYDEGMDDFVVRTFQSFHLLLRCGSYCSKIGRDINTRMSSIANPSRNCRADTPI